MTSQIMEMQAKQHKLLVLLRNIICHKGLSGTGGKLIADCPFGQQSTVAHELNALAEATGLAKSR